MADHLPNYLKSYRKRAGLSQTEVAFLLGDANRSTVSRYESQDIMPPLPTVLALEAVLGASVSELFSGVYQSVEIQTIARMKELIVKLEQRNSEKRYRLATLAKLSRLKDHPLLSAEDQNTITCT
jgi:transcriptional regulator with XRE-family HTH domain